MSGAGGQGSSAGENRNGGRPCAGRIGIRAPPERKRRRGRYSPMAFLARRSAMLWYSLPLWLFTRHRLMLIFLLASS